MIDPRKLRPGELCRLLNSTPLGEVITEQQFRRHRMSAGIRIGDGQNLDLLRFAAWLVQRRHLSKPEAKPATEDSLAERAGGAAALGSSWKQTKGHGQKLTSKQEALIAALLTETSYASAARKAGIGETTLYRWLHLREFREAYRHARRELIEAAIGRIQAATGQAVDTLVEVSRKGRRDGDRVRAAVALLDHACRGLEQSDLVHAVQGEETSAPMNTAEVVGALSTRLARWNDPNYRPSRSRG